MLTRRQLFEVLFEDSSLHKRRHEKEEHLVNYLMGKCGNIEDEHETMRIKKSASRFCCKLFSRWNKCNRSKERFLQKYNDWLDKDYDFLEEEEEQIETAAIDEPSTSTGVGRRKLSFEESSTRSRRRKAANLSNTFGAEELGYAAKMGLRRKGKQEEAKLINEAMFTTPTRATKIRKTWQTARKSEDVIPLTPEEAVSLIVEAKLTKHQYQLIRQQAKEKHADIYPSYQKVLEAKVKCYPSNDTITVTENSVEVQVQSLLDHTTTRILETQKPVLKNLGPENVKNLTLFVKWGCDGSSGHSQYKQQFSDPTLSDNDLFLTSIVPLELNVENDNEKIIIWRNPRPSSTRFCRPIRIQLLKETVEVAQNEKKYIQNQIDLLSPTIWTCKEENLDISVSYKCIMTMINGKICNAITDTRSSQTCYICKATPKEMNNIETVMTKEMNEETFQFGLSPLHAFIRFFECLLHVSYRLEIKKWQVRSNQKQMVDERKRHIQDEFKLKMGLLVDQPKGDGSGTTNDGNTARRFFNNPSLSASITGINEELIRRFAVILQTISCGYEVNPDAFQEYGLNTARLFVSLYPWYYMPASVHKILIHGSPIIKFALLPIGLLSEEAQESRNKDLKRFREFHTRKMSRLSTNQDLFNRFLLTSDPLISSLRKLPRKTTSKLMPEVLKLLKDPAAQTEEEFPDVEHEDIGGSSDGSSSGVEF